MRYLAGLCAQGFNLATTSASWRTTQAGVAPSANDAASIWPRRQRRGEPGRQAGDDRQAQLQFGHDVSVVENTSAKGVTFAVVGLQFGHDVSVVENVKGAGNVLAVAEKLQFGHDVSVVENGRDRRHPDRRDAASIWPRRQRRGEHARVGRRQALPAASIWPRRQRRGELRRPDVIKERLGASIWPRRQRRGEHAALDTKVARVLASIWPRRQRRGERGAGAGSKVLKFLLQFGHDVSVVENRVPEGHRRDHRRASIWPRRQRRGELAGGGGGETPLVASIWPRRQRRGEPRRPSPGSRAAGSFNLATTSASWRTAGRRRTGGRRGRFNLATTSASWRTPHDGPGVPPHLGASIWPRRQRRGERGLMAARVTEVCASIWPRRQRRGELTTTAQDIVASAALQFGHDVSVVENLPGKPLPLSRPKLQFGHDVSVVENERREREGRRRLQAASIWPRRQRRGEPGGGRGPGRRQEGFNLATTSASWRTQRRNERVPQRVASIWPRRQRRGEPWPQNYRPTPSTGFNLATTSASWRT